MEYRYSIHGLIEIESDVSLRVPEYFRAEIVETPDITVERKNFQIDRSGLRKKKRKDYTVWVSDEGVLIDYEMLDLRLWLESLDGNTVLKVTPKMFKLSTEKVIQLVDELVQLHLLEKGYTFLHSAAVKCPGGIVLLPAMGSTGKTYTTLSLIDGQERFFVSDDRVIIDADAEVYGFPESIRTGPYTLQNSAVPELSINPKISSKLAEIPLISILYGKFSWLYPSRDKQIPDRLIRDRGLASHAFTITAGSESHPIQVDSDEMLRRTLIQHFDTFVPFSNFILNYCSFLLGYDQHEATIRSREIISSAFDSIDCYDIRNGDKDTYPQQILTTIQ